jgi:hypothetical protein
MGRAAARIQRLLERIEAAEAGAKENPPAIVATIATVGDPSSKSKGLEGNPNLLQFATVATIATPPPRTVATIATIAGGLSREGDPTPSNCSNNSNNSRGSLLRSSTPSTSNCSNNSNNSRGSLLHPEDARDLAEAVSYLRGATKEEAVKAGKEAARDPSEVPLSDYEATLDDCGLAYWWCGDRYHVQGGYIREWFKQSRTPSWRRGK